MSLGLGNNLSKSGLATPGIVTDSLVLKHNYAAGGVVPVSDGAALFDGTDDYIAIGAKPVDTADATYCFWANSSVTGDNRSVFAHGATNKGEFALNHSTTGKPLLYLNGDLYQYWADTGFADDGKWHHWAVVVDISSMSDCKLYCDGALVPQDARVTTDAALAYGNMTIGGGPSVNFYEGYICNFGVWSSLLTQAQIKSIMWKNYAGLTSSETDNLVSWWNLDAQTGTDGLVGGIGGVKDHHGSNHGDLE